MAVGQRTGYSTKGLERRKPDPICQHLLRPPGVTNQARPEPSASMDGSLLCLGASGASVSHSMSTQQSSAKQ